MILILEDAPGRLQAFLTALASAAPGMDVEVWSDAHAMIREIAEHLARSRLISLDHDLDAESGSPDPGEPGDGALRRRLCATTARKGGRHVEADWKQPCCTRDEGRSLGLGVQAQGPNHRMLLRSNGWGGERDGKGGTNPSGKCWEDERE